VDRGIVIVRIGDHDRSEATRTVRRSVVELGLLSPRGTF
jgi:hypothetical protein